MAYVNLGQVIYPVGAIFASTSSTSPSSMFGGTWSQITDDACLMAGDAGVSVGYYGTKAIRAGHLPPHKHKIGWYSPDGELIIEHPLEYVHKGPAKEWNGITTEDNEGGAELSALLLQMLYVEENSLIAVMLHA